MRDRHSGLTNGQFNIYQLSGVVFLTDLIDDDKKETTSTDCQSSNEKKETVVDTVCEDKTNTGNTVSSEGDKLGDKYESKSEEEILSELVKDVYSHAGANTKMTL